MILRNIPMVAAAIMFAFNLGYFFSNTIFSSTVFSNPQPNQLTNEHILWEGAISEALPANDFVGVEPLCLRNVIFLKSHGSFQFCHQSILANLRGTRKVEALARLFSSWIKLQREDALLILESEYVSRESLGVLGNLFALSSDALAQYYTWVMVQEGDNISRYRSLRTAFLGLAYLDPSHAIASLSIITEEPLRNSLLDSLIQHWANEDANAAVDWLVNAPYAIPFAVERSVFNALIQQNMSYADVYFSLLDDINHKSVLAYDYGLALAKEDTQAALDWLASNIREPYFAAALEGVLNEAPSLTQYHELLFNYVLRVQDAAKQEHLFSLLSQFVNVSAAEEIIENYISTHTPAARRFADALVLAWIEQHPNDAANWLLREPSGQFIDELRLESSHRISVSHPRLAMNIAEQISDSQLRLQALIMIFEQWKGIDSEAAHAEIDTLTSLSRESKQTLVDVISNSPYP